MSVFFRVVRYVLLCGYTPFQEHSCGQNCGWNRGLKCDECQVGVLLSRLMTSLRCLHNFSLQTHPKKQRKNMPHHLHASRSDSVLSSHAPHSKVHVELACRLHCSHRVTGQGIPQQDYAGCENTTACSQTCELLDQCDLSVHVEFKLGKKWNVYCCGLTKLFLTSTVYATLLRGCS